MIMEYASTSIHANYHFGAFIDKIKLKQWISFTVTNFKLEYLDFDY